MGKVVVRTNRGSKQPLTDCVDLTAAGMELKRANQQSTAKSQAQVEAE